jgi:monoamine oxidase
VTSPLGMLETGVAVGRLEARRRLVNPDAPWRSRGAARLDSVTLGHWARNLRSATARATISIVTRTVLGVEPEQVSMLFFLWYLRSGGGYRSVTEFAGGAQDSRLVGGAQQVCDRLGDELGDALTLDSPVRAIEQGDQGVRVRGDVREATARRVVIALAPPLAARIDFDPPLPPERESLDQRMAMGAYMKGVAVYDHAWWRHRGLSGVAFADDGPVQMVIDDSPPGGEPGVLVAFVTGAPARAIGRLRPEARRAAVLEALGRMVAPEASHPSTYRDLNWLEEPWSRGAPTASMGPGTLTGLGPALRRPVGPVHWAGTETATEWSGYMDGAVQAGARAGQEVLRALG